MGARAVSGNGDIIEFGRFRLHRRDRTLLADGVELELGARAIDVLLALIDAGGAMLSKDELLSRVWPDAVVEENNLHVQIFALRRALGADRDVIRTVPRHGYRFTGALTAASRSASAADVAPAPIVPSASNLPIQVGELIGREADLQQVVELQTTYRLLTLTGPGGIGKTSLALSAAWRLVDRYPDGVRLADLATLADPNLVLSTIAAALGLQRLPSPLLPEHVAASLESRRLLLVLDNCEHLIEPVARIAEALLHGASHLQILATSREPLRADGECVYSVPALAVPGDEITDTGAQLRHSAVRLFVARARLAGTQLQIDDDRARTISSICRRLDGIPLAIELAAARTAVLGVRGVAAGLDDRFRLLTGGRRTALPRHQTLRATLDWSYGLLLDTERAVLRRLAIFPGGFELKTAKAIMATTDGEAPDVIDSLASLVAKSLVTRAIGSGPVRYRLLDTTRAYALEKLTESGELDTTARRHAEYVRDLLVRAEPERWARSIAEWLTAYGREIDDVRAALDWAFSPGGDTTIGVALMVASEPLWFGLSLMDECRRSIECALSSIRKGVSRDARHEMQLYATLAAALFNTKGPGPEACAAWIDALAIAEELDNTEYRLRALWGLWYNRISNAECQAALALAERFYTLPPNQAGPADRLVAERMLGTSLYYLGDLSNGRRHLEHMLSHSTAPVRQSHIARFQFDLPVAARGTLARILWLQGFPDQAMRMAQDNVEDARAVDHVISLYWALDGACMVALAVGDLATVDRSVAMLLKNSAKHALDFWQALGHSYQGQLLIKRGNVVTGVQYLRTGLDELEGTGYVLRSPGLLGALAEGLAGVGQVTEGLRKIDEALARCERTDERWSVAELLRIRGELLLLQGEPEASAAAEDHYRQGLDVARQQETPSWELRCATSLARLWRDQARSEQARELLASVYDRFTEGFATADLKAARRLSTRYYRSSRQCRPPRISKAAHTRQQDHVPWARHLAHRHMHKTRRVRRERLAQRVLQHLRRRRAPGAHSEALCECNEIWVGQVAGDQPVAVLLALDAPHIAERAVVEYHRYDRQLVSHRRCQLLRLVHESAIAGDRNHLTSRQRSLRAERDAIAPAQRILMPGRKICPRRIDGERQAAGEPDLSDILNVNPIIR